MTDHGQRASAAPADASFSLRDVGVSLLRGTRQWRLQEDDHWCYLTPPGHSHRIQGWKLHVSATWLSAPLVLHHAGQVLVEHGCAFKFAATVGQVRAMTDKTSSRSQAGKFITAYPCDDDQLRELAPLLDQATAGLPGPTILSDRAVREGSLVHYRYGAFTGVPTLTNDGLLEMRIEDPNGDLVTDPRHPWFCPPAWAPLPFTGPPGREAARPNNPPQVLLDGRFRVQRAIRHSARGGVFRAVDQQTGQRVVVKQARAHIAGLNLDGDARDGLRHESEMLAALGELGPRPVRLFAQGTHLFLAVEELAGEPLRSRVHRWWREAPANDPHVAGLPVDLATTTARRLADLVAGVHERGLVFRDLTPGNVMVLPDGSLRLIDAELATRPGQWVAQAHTPGFVAPEVLSAPTAAPAPGPAADHYSLGALLCYLVTGQAPAYLPDSPGGGRTHPERIALTLRYAVADNPAAQRLAPAILGLTAEDPAARWDTERLRKSLSADATHAPPTPGAAPGGMLEPELLPRLVEDGLVHLASSLANHSPDRLVPTGGQSRRSDPCNVQHGAAGVLAVLVRGGQVLDPRSEAAGRVTEAIGGAARWLDRRRSNVSPLLPGLYFGRAGTAWALYEAARHLDDPAMASRALELAAALPVRWPNPDVAHGTAGAGLASLHLWHRSGQPSFLQRAQIAADYLLEQVRHTDDGRLYWQVSPDFDSHLAGTTQYGFAHGVAGIAAFLLAAAQASGRTDYQKVATQAGQTLVAAAIRSAGAAYWPNDLSGPSDADLRYHWCSGASGVGTFLLRLWQATGEQQYRELAVEAAVMVRRGRWLSGISGCHGLAGDGEFLLDLAVDPDIPSRDWARQLAACLYSRHARRNGRAVIWDPLDRVNLDFNTGMAGVVGYLLRLRYGGPRWWMVDQPAPAWGTSR